ncbi:LCP family protein [Caldalkalibacillus salinus]|uniref:LCP family protein n=1 Tax=Caldalkalibacillus salinus TaxID=2803787 RepID=UPI0019233581|nr:LCP family protein [Caldalkalibacillus salinus]
MSNFNEVSRSKSHDLKKRRRKKSIIGMMIWMTVFFMLGTITVFGYTYWKVDQAFHKVSKQDKVSAATQDDTPPSASEDDKKDGKLQEEEDQIKPLAVAIIGTDRRTGSGGTLNTDVLMVALIDRETPSVSILSIPRDTKVQIPGHSGYIKANAVFARGEAEGNRQKFAGEEPTTSGTQLVKETLSEYLEIPVDYHVHIGFQGFVDVVDAVGGVEVDVSRSMKYHDPEDGTQIDIPRGVQVLNGYHALGYIRHRLDDRGEAYYSSDFERNERQHEVIREITDRLTTVEGLSKMDQVLDAVVQNVSTNFTPDEMKELIWDLKSLSPSDLESIENDAYWDSSQGYTIIPDERIEEIKKQFQDKFE